MIEHCLLDLSDPSPGKLYIGVVRIQIDFESNAWLNLTQPQFFNSILNQIIHLGYVYKVKIQKVVIKMKNGIMIYTIS